ncbi:hypothetical protein OC834_007705 [Tilletia horrida]|nr:hypothetical protein OC834_007705 [Tilletia horrida]
MSSSTNGLSTFAVLGAGTVGGPIIDAFLDAKLPLTILTRDASKPELQPYAQRGAVLKSVDYSSVDSIAEALQGVDAFVSALGNQHPPQLPEDLARAAKQAGVKLFVPSEFGLDYVSEKAKPFPSKIQGKVDHHAFLESLSLPWIAVACSGFGQFVVHPFLGYDLSKRTVVLLKEGDAPLSLTDTRDIGTFLVKVLTTQPVPAPGSGRIYRVEGYTTTQRDIISELEKQSGHKFTIIKKSYEEVAAKQTEDSYAAFPAWLQASLADGRQKLDNIDNERVGFTPKYTLQDNIKEALEEQAKSA